VTPSGSDLVHLHSFDEMMANPTLIKELMESQGVTGIDYVDPIGPTCPPDDCPYDQNYKGYIYWTDRTETKV